MQATIDLSFVTNEGYADLRAKRCRPLAITSPNIFPFFFFCGEAVRENPDLHIVDQTTLEKARNHQQIFQADSLVKVRMAKYATSGDGKASLLYSTGISADSWRVLSRTRKVKSTSFTCTEKG